MSKAIVFFVVATLMLAYYRLIGEARIRIVARRSESDPSEILELAKANHISSIGLVVSATVLILIVFGEVLIK